MFSSVIHPVLAYSSALSSCHSSKHWQHSQVSIFSAANIGIIARCPSRCTCTTASITSRIDDSTVMRPWSQLVFPTRSIAMEILITHHQVTQLHDSLLKTFWNIFCTQIKPCNRHVYKNNNSRISVNISLTFENNIYANHIFSYLTGCLRNFRKFIKTIITLLLLIDIQKYSFWGCDILILMTIVYKNSENMIL